MGCSSTKTASDHEHKQPAHVHKQPAHVHKQPAPVHKQPDPVQNMPDPVQKTTYSVESEMSDEMSVPVQKSINNENRTTLNYASVDKHARKAPHALRNSVHELVAYLTKPSTEPMMIARAIYVWITENIAYDTDGYFGRSEYASCDAVDVIKSGKGVCWGYANVMETLCREACIPARTIYGYAKGYSHSDGSLVSTSDDPNHAWNVVQLNDKWNLIDSTWGAGNVDTSHRYEKCFKEFYFLTNPEEFIYSHYPYMDNDMEESMKWQLLENPVTLQQFNKLMIVEPNAFALGVRPISHKDRLILMRNELTMSFQCVGKDELLYMTKLMHQQGNMLYKQPRATFDQFENGLLTTRIHPSITGIFHLKVYGRKSIEKGSYDKMLEYLIICEKADDGNFRFPETSTQAQVDRCILIEPLQGQLIQNSAVTFHITSPVLKRVKINHTYLEKIGDSFKGTVKTGAKGETVSVCGSRNNDDRLVGLYKFEIV